jgi:hypothetical protein
METCKATAAEGPGTVPGKAGPLEARLEQGEILVFSPCPVPLPEGEAREFLLQQRAASSRRDDIIFDPRTGNITGVRHTHAAQPQQLRATLSGLVAASQCWLRQALPRYADGCRLREVRFHVVEEVTRRLPPWARNDVLHVDAGGECPTQGQRILRLFINLHTTEPRVWAASELFAQLLARYGRAVGLPCTGRGWRYFLSGGLFRPSRSAVLGPEAYDDFMHRFAEFLRTSHDFQDRASKRLWKFPPGAAWLAFTDQLCHAELRGRFVLDQCYYVPLNCLVFPDEAPYALLGRTANNSLLPPAA